ncbi:replicative DNA helicase [Streptomyces sp. NPDC059096]|uniref:replicative DNA helicase n=1 Tax=Streptomyces sp. NPDC059096 TaxID=3346727 RepID=UPI0036C4A827
MPELEDFPRQQGSSGGVLPQALEAEMSVLGAMLLGKDAIADILDCPMQPRDYYRPTHETIHTAILALYVNGEPADPITVAAELAERGELTKAGGAPYLHTLVQAVPTAANATYYADIVHEQAVLRRLTTAGGRIAQLGVSGEGGLDEIRSAAEAELLDALKGSDQTFGYAPVGTDVPVFWDSLETRMRNGGGVALTGVPTGLEDLDSLTGGLIVIGARPAMGKSTLALDIGITAFRGSGPDRCQAP